MLSLGPNLRAPCLFLLKPAVVASAWSPVLNTEPSKSRVKRQARKPLGRQTALDVGQGKEVLKEGRTRVRSQVLRF